MKVLLTGARGNLGTALQASGVGHFVQVGRGDWSRLSQLLGAGVDSVLHAAWDLRTPITRSPEELFDANMMTTTRLLEACRSHRVPKFAFVSSCAVYGDSTNTAEEVGCFPVSVNGITKLLNERIVEAFCVENGIECQIYRVFNMFGGEDRFSILSHLKQALVLETPFVLNNAGTAQRDFIHVTDVAKIILMLLQKSLPVMRLNIGTGRTTRISDIVRAVQRLHPEFRTAERVVSEAEYSRADTTRMLSFVGPYRFAEVMPLVEEMFDPAEIVSVRRELRSNGVD